MLLSVWSKSFEKWAATCSNSNDDHFFFPHVPDNDTRGPLRRTHIWWSLISQTSKSPNSWESHGIYLAGVQVRKVSIKAIFMQYPLGFSPSGSSPSVENKSFLQPKKCSIRGAVYLSVSSCAFPIPRYSCSVGPHPTWVFSISEAKEIPLSLSHLGYICNPLTLLKW